MGNKEPHKTVSIRITVIGVFIAVAGLTAGLSLGLQYYFSRDLAKSAAENSFKITSERVGERIKSLDVQSANLVSVLSNFTGLEKPPGLDHSQRMVTLFGGAMEQNPNLYAIYIGYDSGEFFEVINLESSRFVRAAVAASPQDRWFVISINNVDGALIKTVSYLDSSRKVRFSHQQPLDYDPRERPWFKMARSAQGVVRTAPYIFSVLKAPGVTYARSVNGGQRVLAVDISLACLTNFLQKQRFLPHSQAFLFDRKGDVIASASDREEAPKYRQSGSLNLTSMEKAFIKANPVVRASNEMDWPPFDFAVSGKPRGYSIDMLNLLAQKAGFQIQYVNGYSWGELMDLFGKGRLDLLHSLQKNSAREKLGLFSKPYLPMPQAFAVKSGDPIPASIADLNERTVAVPKDWATDAFLAKHFPEIRRLNTAGPLESLRAVSEGKADVALESESVLRYLAKAYFIDNLTIGGHPPELSGAGDQGLHFLIRPEKTLLASILNKALAGVTKAERARLEAKWLNEGGPADAAEAVEEAKPDRQLLELAVSASPDGDLRFLKIKGREFFGFVIRIESIYGSNEFLGLLTPVRETLKPYMEKVNLSLTVTLGLLILLVPVVWYCGTIIVKPINILAQENEKIKQRRYDDVTVVKSNITEIVALSKSLVSMASSIKAYEESLQELMESFIRLIATAIDRKSPYTGGHCSRVPVLSVMLAQAAQDSTDGPFADFSFKTKDEWREFRTAAWLHDCGKVITPEYIVDKSTKLETIYNRIHEVRMRFEVLLRDAEIEYWQAAAGGGDRAALAQSLEKKRREIMDDFAFIAKCNIGGEFMAEEKIARVGEIAAKTWTRHLDDRLGLSDLELMRYPEETSPPPCQEPLLADRPEHLIRRIETDASDQDSFGFTMEVPEYLYNLGEIYNLTITRGTLTAEDRYKINEHITTTIQMLETLPFPETMAKIPEYAGAHHETLSGSGYPRKLIAEEIGLPARMMAVADIFEALTASDRPYKKPKKLSEAIRIMSFMVKDRHLDADLFKLFLESGVYLEYAEQFLDPAQIDEVNPADYTTSSE